MSRRTHNESAIPSNEPARGRAGVPLAAVFAVLVLVFMLASYTGVAQASGAFGVSAFTTTVSSSQAGAHADFTTTFALNRESLGGPAGQLRNLTDVLPVGLVGDPQDVPRCTTAQLSEFDCQPSAQVGVLTSHFALPAANVGEEPLEFEEQTGVYNMVPSPGHPATFATSLAFATVLIQADVLRDGTYRLVASVHEISTLEPLVASSLTMWGVPADSSHDGLRFGPPPNYGTPTRAGAAPAPFMINASDCTDGPLESELSVESWLGQSASASASMLAPTGCNALHAAPVLSVAPETTQAGSPSGYDVSLSVPQELAPYSLATPDLRDATVTLPAGTVVSPSAAKGLQTCSEEQIGLDNGNPIGCPDAAKVGTVEIITPLLGAPLHGSVFAAAQGANPFGSLLAIYLAAEGEGVQVKLAGRVSANPATGQLSTTFTDNPKVPFSELKVHLFGGSGAVLSNPTACGQASSSASLTFYSSSTPLESSSVFGVTGCAAPQFSPGFVAGTTSAQAGAFSTLSATLSRSDADEDFGGLQVTGAPGLEAILAGVPLCGEPQASKGECSAASQIGHTVVGAGPGPNPFYVPEAGQPPAPVYLTTGYKGAPFGLSVVVPAVAGPFNLGTVVVRAAVSVDSHTAQAVVTSDPLPQILQGIPLQVRTVNVVIDREHFIFNPTSCEPQKITGTVTSAQGDVASVQSPFGVSGCRTLGFHPTVSVSTAAHPSKANGAGLFFNIGYPKGAMGKESWFDEAKFVIPKQLPARLTTLQQACLASVFEANPAACPPASTIGHVVVHTPLLAVPLSGPVFFVSYGGAKFPDAVLVLQGDGVTVELHGETLIKNGVTSATFHNTPDVPFENIEVSVPTGPFSEFGANLPAKAKGSFCGQKLVLPTTFKSQNGQEIHQNTPIAVTGCRTPKKAKKAKKAGKARRTGRAARNAHTGNHNRRKA